MKTRKERIGLKQQKRERQNKQRKKETEILRKVQIINKYVN